MLSKTLGSVLVTVLMLYVFLVAMLYFFQEKLLFPSRPLPPDFQFHFDVPFTELTIPVAGAELNALHFQQEDPSGVIFFLHGNGGNLDGWTTNIDYYRQINYDLFIFDYRGYGKSTGSITSQQQLMDDVRAAWQAMQARYAGTSTGGQSVIIYGRSLGAALAAQLATEVDAELVILVSPFTSMLAMANQQYPFVPRALVRYPLRTDTIIEKIKQPMLIIHGDNDRLIPLRHSEDLLLKAKSAARLLVVSGAGHNDIQDFSDYLQGLAEALP